MGGRHAACDVLDTTRLAQVVERLQPQVVIHAQALSDVDRCELEPTLAREQNVRATIHLIEAIRPLNPLFIQLSTDYVFDGTKGAPYTEADAPNPLSVYGRSKWDAEQLALSYSRGIVIRPSTLFGPGRMNFCQYLAERLAAHQPVDAFLDQTTSPTYTVDLAEGIGALCQALEPVLALGTRIYHVANVGGASRVDVAERVADVLGAPRELIQRIPMRAQHRPALRPAYSALSSAQFTSVVGQPLRSWESALTAYLRERTSVTS